MMATSGQRRASSSKPCHFFHGQSGLQPGCSAIVCGGKSKFLPEATANGSGNSPSQPNSRAIRPTHAMSPAFNHSD